MMEATELCLNLLSNRVGAPIGFLIGSLLNLIYVYNERACTCTQRQH